MLFGSLVELHAWLHSCLCFSLLEKVFLSNLDTSSTSGYLLSSQTISYCNLDTSSTARWIEWESSWILNSFSTVGGSIEIPLTFCWIIPRQILDSCICRRLFARHLSRHLSRHLLTPLSIEIYWTSIYRFCAIQLSFLSISLSIALSPHLPNHSLLLQTSFPSDFQGFFFTWYVSYLSFTCISCFKT